MRTSTDPPADHVPPTAEHEHHPAAALFPLLPIGGPEFGELVTDIDAHGLLQPIVLHEGQVLDGRNRYRACRQPARGRRALRRVGPPEKRVDVPSKDTG